MKNIFYILLLLPTIIFAQYPSNSGHKITLGEQTTADGLIWRGVAADTTLTAKSDTAAYFVLDTVNLNLYTYKISASGRKWRQLGADTAAIAYVNTYGTQTVNGEKTFTNSFRVPNIGVGRNADVVSNYGAISLDGNTGSFIRMFANGVETFRITNGATVTQIAGIERGFRFDAGSQNYALNILADGKTGFSVITPTEKLHVDGNGLFTGNLGVGGVTPTSRLHVKGVTNTSGQSSLNVTNSSDAPLLFVRNDGNVGIGTSTPTEKLHVIGNALFDNSSAGTAQIRFKGTGTTTGFDIQSSANDGYLWNRDNGAFYFGTNNTQRLVISNTGAATFSGSVTNAGSIYTTNDVVFNTAGSITKHSTVGLVLKGVTASVFDFAIYSAGGTALMTNITGTNNINFNSGNVGIGTNPTFKLDVNGNGRFSDSIVVNKKIITGSTVDGGGFYMKKGSNVNSKTYFFYNDAYDNGDFGISQEGVVAMLLLSRQGFFGINQPVPTERLHVVGNGLFTGSVGIGSATPTTSGSGITFPATQSASTNVNTLDDYEEGIFQVELKFGGNNTGYTFYGNAGVFGKYTKIGNVVCVTIMVGILSKAAGASTGAATITGLPFTSASNGVNLGGGINISDAISIDGASFYMTSNSTTLVLQNGNGVNLTDANFGAFLGEIHMNFVYQVN
jgi:hypothetical protein